MKRRRALLLTLTLVLILCGTCSGWLYVQRQQYNRNRHLIAALQDHDAERAIALINAGADPNTRFIPLPAPTVSLLIAHLLHRELPPVNDSPTAFMFSCGALSSPMMQSSAYVVSIEEDLPLLQVMLAHGADVQARTEDNQTSLHFAVDLKRLHTAELLLQHGADVNAQDTRQRTPLLMLVLRSTPIALVHLLLSHGANPNAEDNYGHTALYYAIEAFDAKGVITELLAHGADPNLSSPIGLTPLQKAQQEKLPDLVRLLARGAK